MKSTTTILAALALGVASATAGVHTAPVDKNPVPPVTDPCATPLSYNNIELLYAHTDFDGGGDDGNGFKLDIEYSPMNNLFLTAGAQYSDADGDSLWLLNAGVGGYIPLTSNIHLAADGGFLWSRYEYDYTVVGGASGSDSETDSGWYIRPQIRAKWGCLEARIGAIYRDLGNNSAYDGEWALFAKLYYQLTPAWDVTVGIEHDDDFYTQVSGGIRYRF